jgi:hypothetical protein
MSAKNKEKVIISLKYVKATIQDCVINEQTETLTTLQSSHRS